MSTRPLYVLGINAYDHDVSACLLRDGVPVAAISKERITRVKHDSGFYAEVVEYCLEAAGIELGDVDLAVRNSYVLPVPELEERLARSHVPFHLSMAERGRAGSHTFFRAKHKDLVTCSHHLAHAYSAFACSPFDEGAVMVVDGVGSYRTDVLEDVPADSEAPPTAREAESYYQFRGSELETVEKVWLDPPRGVFSDDFHAMDGIGALYSRVSTYVFGNWNRCGEVMGLAPFGDLPADPLMELVDGRLRVAPWGGERCHPFLGGGDEAWKASPHRPEWEAMCRRVQEDTEQILLERARRLHDRTGATNLCLAGGVALNCVANGRILEETPFERVFIQPAAGDDGIAIGCAYYGHVAIRGRPRGPAMETAYLGRSYGDDQIVAATRSPAARFAARARTPDDVVAHTASLLARGKIVGWFQGGSEFGPRALGHRSILADPRTTAMKDKVNERVKHRQGFRPFAPMVLAERAGEYFEGEAESPFMLLVQRVRPEKRDEVAGIVHVDGTARVQTLRRDQDPQLHALIEAFAARTGVPVLLNTSFNDRGMPIVETPADAVGCFLATHLDALVLGDRVLEKRHVHRALHGLFRFGARLRERMTSRRLLERVAEGALYD